MERGALIGGIAVVGLLAVFAAGFVMIGLGPAGTGTAVSQERAGVQPVSVEGRNWEAKPTVEGQPRRTGDLPEEPPVETLDGVLRRPNPEGLGGDVWAEKMRVKNEVMVTRTRGVVASFAADMSESDASQLTSIMENLYTTSSDIRSKRVSGEVPRKETETKMGELKTETISELTALLGGDDFARLRTELRRADAMWF